MTLPGAIALSVLAELLVATMLTTSTLRHRLATEQRLTVESKFALQTAVARSRFANQDQLSGLLPGESLILPEPMVSGWIAEASASRPIFGRLVVLSAQVRQDSALVAVPAQRSGTLLLWLGPADTAFVIRSRSRF